MKGGWLIIELYDSTIWAIPKTLLNMLSGHPVSDHSVQRQQGPKCIKGTAVSNHVQIIVQDQIHLRLIFLSHTLTH